MALHSARNGALTMFSLTNQEGERECMLLISVAEAHKRVGGLRRSLSSSGSNQAREGRLVDALAVRGDEGRDTLRKVRGS